MQTSVFDSLTEDDRLREFFLSACLGKLGLQVNEEHRPAPPLSRMYLSGLRPVCPILRETAMFGNGTGFIEGGNDVFRITATKGSNSNGEDQSHTKVGKEAQDNSTESVKDLTVCEDRLPSPQETPFFDHAAFYSELERLHQLSESQADRARPSFGTNLLYSETVDSTNTLLEK